MSARMTDDPRALLRALVRRRGGSARSRRRMTQLPAAAAGCAAVARSVLGAGKAGGAMAAGARCAVAARRAAVGPGRHALRPRAAGATRQQPGRIEVVEAAHPVPDAAGLQRRRSASSS